MRTLMVLSIGTNIKNLRAKHKITQDQLATFLGITSQAISRWENGTVYPDIEMLPSIAEFFGVSTDDLLGINKDEKGKRRDEIYLEIEKGYESGENIGEDAVLTARQYAAEFPADEWIVLNLANTIARSYMWKEETRGPRYLAESEKLYQTLIDTAEDSDIRFRAIQNLATLYTVGYDSDEKADEVLSKLPPMRFSREWIGALLWKESGHNIGRWQDWLDRTTNSLCLELTHYIVSLPNEQATWEKKVEMLEKVITIYELVFGEDMLSHHSGAENICRVIATYYVAQGRYEETIQWLEKMTYHIKERIKVKPGDHYTSPFVDTISVPEDDPLNRRYHELILHNEAWYVLNHKLTQSRYDPIREMDGFRAVVDELTKIAE